MLEDVQQYAPLTSMDTEEVRFSTVKGRSSVGYDTGEVDRYIHEDVADSLNRLHAEIARLNRDNAWLQQRVRELAAQGDPEAVRMRVARQMAGSNKHAEGVISAAEARGRQIIEDARTRAAEILATTPPPIELEGMPPLPPAPQVDRTNDVLARGQWVIDLSVYLSDRQAEVGGEITALLGEFRSRLDQLDKIVPGLAPEP